MKKFFLLSASVILFANKVKAQDNFALSTGNYAGISGLGLNPASIVDSRYKFDLNIFGFSNYYTNNFLLLRRDAFLSGNLFNNKYDSYEALRSDLLAVNDPGSKERVYARLTNRIQMPLSFMLTTGRKSAIAFSINNRTNVMADNFDRDFTQLAYDRFRNTDLYNRDFNMNGASLGLLNWMDIGFTYGRVLLDRDKHFLKGAVTAKYLMGAASGYMKADNLTLRFADSSRISAQSPLVRYGHSSHIDQDILKATDFNWLNSISGAAGMDIGLVYEYRGKIDKFKYISPEFDVKDRRDKNKYAFRLSTSVVDIGRFRFNKGGYNSNFSANFNNFDVSGLAIRSVQNLDTALASQVNYLSDVSSYTVALPTALNLQADVHLVKGFYVNASTYQPFNIMKADQRMAVTAAYAITPRFETRFFGVYVPVTYNNLDKVNVGATLRVGPLYVGSANLGTLAFNEKTRTANVHAGLRIPIGYGKPTKIGNWFNKATRKPIQQNETTIVYPNEPDNEAKDTVIVKTQNDQMEDARDKEIEQLRNRINELERKPVDNQRPTLERNPLQPIYITINNYGNQSGASTVVIDTLLRQQVPNTINNQQQPDTQQPRPQQEQQTQYQPAPTPQNSQQLEQQLQQQSQQLQLLEQRLKQIEAENIQLKMKQNATEPTGYSNPQVDFKKLEADIASLRTELQNHQRSMAFNKNATTTTSPNVVVVPTPPVVVNKEVEKKSVVRDTIVQVQKQVDTVWQQKVIRDTVVKYVRDTVLQTDTVERVVRKETLTDNTMEHLLAIKLTNVLFDIGKSNVKPIFYKQLDFVVKQLKQYPELKVQLTGHTDKTGNAAANQILSEKRAEHVKQYLISKGVQSDKIILDASGAAAPIEDSNTATANLMSRRVELMFVK